MADKKGIIVLLTLEKHKDGVWITRLMAALAPAPAHVVTLESLLNNLDTAQPLFSSSCALLVNRVSDAAPPHLQKACEAVLQLAILQRIPVWNGPISYSLCSNKWCHHVLFQQAGLSSPRTRALLEPTTETLQQASHQVRHDTEQQLLLKPNAGGFGAGVQLMTTPKEDLRNATTFADQVALVQQHVTSEFIYRVWFLNGKVQCGIVRSVDAAQDQAFTTGCVGNACTRTKNVIKAYAIPNDVKDELQDRLLPLLPDAHCGSVEFLHDAQGTRLYFDLNLLSTLPLVEAVQDNQGAWPNDYDPWKELAEAIVAMSVQCT